LFPRKENLEVSINYTVKENALQPGTFYARPVAQSVHSLATIIRNIAYATALSPSEVRAVVEAFTREVLTGLADGMRVSIDGLANFRVRMAQVLDSADGEFDPAQGGRLYVAASVKPALTRQLRAMAQYEKSVTGRKLPVLVEFVDVQSKLQNQYTPGSIGELNGKFLRIDDENDVQQGLFFIDASDGSEAKVGVLQRNSSRKLVFLTPAPLAGPQLVEVRTRYTPGGELRSAQLASPITPAV
jgi:hypothetical protein